MRLFIFSLKIAKYLISKFREIYDWLRSLEKSSKYVKKPEWHLVAQKNYITSTTAIISQASQHSFDRKWLSTPKKYQHFHYECFLRLHISKKLHLNCSTTDYILVFTL